MQHSQEQQERFDREATRFIVHHFGKNYAEASLAKLTGRAENLERARSWLACPSNFLVYLGSPGIAKSYFLAACARHFFATRPSGKDGRGWLLPPDIAKYTEKSFYSRLKSKFDDTGDVSGYGKYLADCDIFMLDELGKAMGTDWQCEQLFDLIDERYNSTLPTLIVSNMSQKQIEDHYGPRYGKYLTSRLFDKRNCVLEDWSGTDIRREGI